MDANTLQAIMYICQAIGIPLGIVAFFWGM